MEKTVPFCDLKTHYKKHEKELNDCLSSVCSSGSFILGEKVFQFEKKIANYFGVRDAIGVASGSDALTLSLMSLDLEIGDEVIIPANTFVATALSASRLGLRVKFADVHKGSSQISLDSVKLNLTAKTKAIIPVHLYGTCLEMNEILDFSKTHGLYVIEDACQAHGAQINNRYAGTFGDTGCFSFYPTKNLGAVGDGGLIITNDLTLSTKIRELRNYGSSDKNVHYSLGINSRLDEIQASVLSYKLNYLDEWNQKRRELAQIYISELKELSCIKLPLFDESKPEQYVFHLFVIRTKKRDDLKKFLEDRGIETAIHYPFPIHLQKAYQRINNQEIGLSVSEELANEILSLPLFPELKKEDVLHVSQMIKSFHREYYE